MADWELSPDEQAEWEAFVEHTREHTVRAMEESAFVMQLVPKGEPDIKFCVELGLSIMLDKPIFAVAAPGQKIPKRLAQIADVVVLADIDTEEGREAVLLALSNFEALHPEEGE